MCEIAKKGVKSLIFQYETHTNHICSCSTQELGWLYGKNDKLIRCEKMCEVIDIWESMAYSYKAMKMLLKAVKGCRKPWEAVGGYEDYSESRGRL